MTTLDAAALPAAGWPCRSSAPCCSSVGSRSAASSSGRIVERPWAEGGMVGARPTVHLTLAADHRASDGHDGSRFLATIDHLLHTPEDL